MDTQQLLQVTGFSEEGWGIAENPSSLSPSKQVIIPYALPHETVKATVQKTGRWTVPHEAVDREFLKLSNDREKPVCRHFGTCGGCRWQHASNRLQIEEKERRVRNLFSPFFADQQEFQKVWHPLLPSVLWQYRNKMEYTFSTDKKGQKFLGLISAGTKGRVCTIEECFLVAPWFAQTLATVRSWWEKSELQAYRPGKDQGTLRTLTVRHGFSSGDRMVILTVSGNPEFAITKQQTDLFVAALNQDIGIEGEGTLSIILRIHQAKKGHPTEIYEMVLQGPDFLRETVLIQIGNFRKEYEFHIGPQAFFQPNSLQAGKLYARAIELAQIKPSDVVYDLYCGIGVFGTIAASFAKEVVAVELSRESAVDAEANAVRLKTSNFRFFQGDVAVVLHTHKEIPAPDVVIVDPPRSGLTPKAVEEIIGCNPVTIVYVSCNPKTQARDIALFLEKDFVISAIQPVDQFPQTVHIENIVILRKALS